MCFAQRVGWQPRTFVNKNKVINMYPDNMSFSVALNAIKLDNKKVSRTGWNGKNMYVVLQKGYPNGIPINKNTAEATGLPEGTVCVFRPYLAMKTVDNEFVPWVASQSDLLAEDWFVVM